MATPAFKLGDKVSIGKQAGHIVRMVPDGSGGNVYGVQIDGDPKEGVTVLGGLTDADLSAHKPAPLLEPLHKPAKSKE